MPLLTPDEALARYSRICRPVNKPAILRALAQYLEWGGQPTDENLAGYLAHLAASGYQPATIDLRRRQIRAFWHALGAPVPRAPLDFHPVQDSNRVALAPAVIARLIRATQDADRYSRALLVLATLYGPRSLELSRVRASDIDGSRWYIRSAKGSPPRWLWIPERVRPTLDSRWPTITPAGVRRQFGRLWLTAELDPHPAGVGWHAIRRSLTEGLSAQGVSDGAIAHFMRWASGGSQGHAMVALYKSPTQTIGLDGESTAPSATPEGSRAEDAAVWAHHPFLAYWPD